MLFVSMLYYRDVYYDEEQFTLQVITFVSYYRYSLIMGARTAHLHTCSKLLQNEPEPRQILKKNQGRRLRWVLQYVRRTEYSIKTYLAS
jgi:hypothetical protein